MPYLAAYERLGYRVLLSRRRIARGCIVEPPKDVEVYRALKLRNVGRLESMGTRRDQPDDRQRFRRSPPRPGTSGDGFSGAPSADDSVEKDTRDARTSDFCHD